jgi:hypothetical protein
MVDGINFVPPKPNLTQVGRTLRILLGTWEQDISLAQLLKISLLLYLEFLLFFLWEMFI